MPGFIVDLNNERHIEEPNQERSSLCGLHFLIPNDNPALALPITCDACRLENGRRIRAALSANPQPQVEG